MQSAWNYCALDALNFLQNGWMDCGSFLVGRGKIAPGGIVERRSEKPQIAPQDAVPVIHRTYNALI
jgi:hypothetical protein